MKNQKDYKEEAFAEMATLTREYLKKHQHHVSRDLMKELYMVVIRSLFKSLFELGKYQFPAGLGALRTKRLSATRRRDPTTGALFEVKRERLRVSYVMGTALKRVMGYANDYNYKPKTDYEDGLAGVIGPPKEYPGRGV